jgi:Xaa-Pro dipeptidase
VLNIGSGNDSILSERMTLYIAPRIRSAGRYGVGFGETVVVTETGCEVMGDVPLELIGA